MGKITTKDFKAAIIKGAGNYAVIARELGLTRQAVRERCERNPQLMQLRVEAEELTVDIAENTITFLMTKAQNEKVRLEAAKFVAERKGSGRGWGKKLDLTATLKEKEVEELSDEELNNLIELQRQNVLKIA